MNRKVMRWLLLAAAGLFFPGPWVRAQGFNPMQYSPANVGSRGYPFYSGSPFSYVPVTTGVPISPPSINYPAFYSPIYQPAYRTTPPSINYPAYVHPRDFAAAPNPVAPAATGYVPVSPTAVPGGAPYQGATQGVINPFNPLPTASDWLENMHLVSSSTPARQPANPFQAKPPSSRPGRPTGNAWIDVDLPANAELWCEGSKTHQTGPRRRFKSPALTPGKEFTYTFRALWREKGKKIERQHQVRISAGDWWHVELAATWSQITAVGKAPDSP